ncbi:T9SS type A sorting domain-containing protein [bacterium]|nr:T9SS type A sorting domain-containing protein [bacterium]
MYKMWTLDEFDIIFEDEIARNVNREIWEIAEVEDAPEPTGKPFAVVVELDDALLECNPYAIELWDGETLVGKTGVLHDKPYTPVIAWEEAPELELDGFTRGNSLIVCIRDEERNILAYFDGGEHYQLGISEGGYDFVSLTGEDHYVGEGGEFEMGEGYPQPFNPSITVPFTIPRAGEVKMSVFDLLGREVFSSQVFYSAGKHKANFDASTSIRTLSSGIFFVRLEYAGQQRIQRAMLLK